MNMRGIVSILLASVALMGCAASPERAISEARPARPATSVQQDLARLQVEQIRRGQAQMQRMDRERALARDRQQMQRNIEGR